MPYLCSPAVISTGTALSGARDQAEAGACAVSSAIFVGVIGLELGGVLLLGVLLSPGATVD